VDVDEAGAPRDILQAKPVHAARLRIRKGEAVHQDRAAVVPKEVDQLNPARCLPGRPHRNRLGRQQLAESGDDGQADCVIREDGVPKPRTTVRRLVDVKFDDVSMPGTRSDSPPEFRMRRPAASRIETVSGICPGSEWVAHP